MITLTERRLQMTISGAIDARKFDNDSTHRVSHMKKVDFILEFNDRYVFIELKDPQTPNAQQYDAPQEFIRSFQSGGIDEDFVYKYRDSFLYELGSGRAEKPIDYFVLCVWDSLDSTQLSRRTEALKSKLPLHGPDGDPWRIARSCAVFNLESWNRTFPEYPVTPLSSRHGQI